MRTDMVKSSWRAILLTALVSVAGCFSLEEKIERSTRTAHSWEATVRKTSHELRGGAVPRVYAKQILRAALAAERQQAQRPEWDAVPQDARRLLARAIAELASSLGEQPDSLLHPS